MSVEESKSTDSVTELIAASREKICKVCGDKALGYNFNALTCESCKAFFRRNALKNKEFKCPFNKKCEINPITRRFCQLCRLIKCFEIGMRKEYIMSEDDKREKRKKIETNRAIKKRAANSDNESSLSSKLTKLQKKEKKEEMEDDGTKKVQAVHSVKINLLNMASASRKTYKKKQSNYDTNAEQIMPFPSPGLPETSSDIVSVTESRTCNVFSESKNQSDSSQSRSVEIYRISKSNNEQKMEEFLSKDCGDPNLIQIILDSEFSKPSAGYSEPTVGKQNEDELCNFNKIFQTGGEPVLSEANVIELPKNNNKNILFEFTKDGKKIFLISNESLEGGIAEASEKKKLGIENSGDHSTPLLTSLINSRRSSDANSSSSSKTPDNIIQDVPKSSVFGASNSIDSILSEAIKLEYEAYTAMNPRMNSRELNDAERAKLNELIVANKALLAPLEDDITGDDFGFNRYVQEVLGPRSFNKTKRKKRVKEKYNKKNLRSRFKINSEFKRSMLVDVLNLTAIAIRRLIKMSKKINAFKNMCQDDQIALLKGGCTEMMILRSAMTYDPDRDSWKIPQSKEKLMNIKVDVLKEAGGKVFEEHQRFLQTFDHKWRNDENIMLILSAIALFTPDRARVVHYDVIKLEQNSYYYLLRRYLESIYQGCEARLAFLKLIHKISELHKLNEDHVRVYLDVNPKEIEPLLIEIFDLKPH